MGKTTAEPEKIKVEIIIRDGCNFSYKTLKSLLLSRDLFPEISLVVVDIADSANDRQTIGGITPSIWVNNKLWFLGSFSSDTFHFRLSVLRTADHIS